MRDSSPSYLYDSHSRFGLSAEGSTALSTPSGWTVVLLPRVDILRWRSSSLATLRARSCSSWQVELSRGARQAWRRSVPFSSMGSRHTAGGDSSEQRCPTIDLGTRTVLSPPLPNRLLSLA
eukprot:scaffold72449_cov30-Tisochrysis_lutea.AAC.1